MKKLIITLSLFFSIGTPSTTQAQNNFPVFGHTYVDTTMTIRDSLYLKNKLTVDELAHFKNGIKVSELARFQENIRVMQTARVDKLVVDGNAIFKGNVRMDSIGVIPNAILNDGTMEFLVVLPNGQVKKGNMETLKTSIYGYPPLGPCEVLYPTLPDGSVTVFNPVWNNGINKIYADYCGYVKVGVGTNNPLYNLDIRGTTFSQLIKVGNLNATQDGMISGYKTGTSAQNILALGRVVGSTKETLFKISSTGSITMENKGNQPSLEMTNGTGKAIIIKKADGTKILQLENDGLLRSREIKIDQQTWADYVFDKNYNLISLEEVAKYIKTYKHLPGIPSQKQIARDGLNLGDMQRLQMEKIEELTLYTIQQDQEIKDLQSQVNHLQKELDEIKYLLLNAKN